MITFRGTSANDVWRAAAGELIGPAAAHASSRLGRIREVLHVVLEVTDPTQRWVLARLPPINPAFAFVELVSLVVGRSDIGFISHWFPRFSEFVGHTSIQYGAYGARLRYRVGFDQLRRAYDALKNNPHSRQVVLQIWNAADDLPEPDGSPRSSDIPCNLISSLKVREGKLQWLQIVRSNDIDRGVPYNFVQFTSLQEIMAGWLGLEVGRYVQVVDSLHWYPVMSERMSVDSAVVPAENTDRFVGDYDSSAASFQRLAERMEAIITARQAGTRPDINSRSDLPESFENIYRIVAADDARRYGDVEVMERLANSCTNPVLRQLWKRWTEKESYAE